MSGWNGATGRGARGAELTLWTCASFIILAAHVGAAAWLMYEPPIAAADEAPPAAIMIEFAEAPEAVSTEENEISPDQETAEASAPAEQAESEEQAEPEEETPPEETEPPPPEPEPDEAPEAESEEREPVEQTTAQVSESVNVPVPLPRPAPPRPKKKVVKKDKPKAKPVQRRRRQAASKQAVRAQARVTQTRRNAARQTASGVSSVSPAKWQSRLMAHLERRKRYPAGARSRRKQGTVYVRFRIDAAGNVLSVSLVRSSGHPELDREGLSLLRRASPVPAPPPGINRTVVAPVRFSVR